MPHAKSTNRLPVCNFHTLSIYLSFQLIGTFPSSPPCVPFSLFTSQLLWSINFYLFFPHQLYSPFYKPISSSFFVALYFLLSPHPGLFVWMQGWRRADYQLTRNGHLFESLFANPSVLDNLCVCLRESVRICVKMLCHRPVVNFAMLHRSDISSLICHGGLWTLTHMRNQSWVLVSRLRDAQ